MFDKHFSIERLKKKSNLDLVNCPLNVKEVFAEFRVVAAAFLAPRPKPLGALLLCFM